MLLIRTCNSLDDDQASHTCSMRLKLLPSVWVTPLKVNLGSVCLNKYCQSFMFRSRPLKHAAMIRSASLEKVDVSDSILVQNASRSQRDRRMLTVRVSASTSSAVPRAAPFRRPRPECPSALRGSTLSESSRSTGRSGCGKSSGKNKRPCLERSVRRRNRARRTRCEICTFRVKSRAPAPPCPADPAR